MDMRREHFEIFLAIFLGGVYRELHLPIEARLLREGLLGLVSLVIQLWRWPVLVSLGVGEFGGRGGEGAHPFMQYLLIDFLIHLTDLMRPLHIRPANHQLI